MTKVKHLSIDKINRMLKSKKRNIPRIKDLVEDVLKNNVIYVEFQKVDGTLREMECTKIESFLPTVVHETKAKTPSSEVVPVFDLAINAWRSFRLDSLKSVKLSKNGKEKSVSDPVVEI